MLLIEDQEPILATMRRYFETHGFEVDGAPAAAARSRLDWLRHDVLIADLRTQAGLAQGLEVLREARARPRSARVVVLTGAGSSEIDRLARCLGADCVVHKPIQLPDLAQIVLGLFGTDRPEAEAAARDPTSEQSETPAASMEATGIRG